MGYTITDGGGRKPCRVSFLASSWTAVASNDFNKRATYLLWSCLIAVVTGLVSKGGAGDGVDGVDGVDGEDLDLGWEIRW